MHERGLDQAAISVLCLSGRSNESFMMECERARERPVQPSGHSNECLGSRVFANTKMSVNIACKHVGVVTRTLCYQ